MIGIGETLPDEIANMGIDGYHEDEFRKFLECGILAKGFARLKCDTCDFERLVPFSCKCRVVCPSSRFALRRDLRLTRSKF